MQHFKTAILYTVLSLLSLIGFAIGILFLPEEVAVHFNYEGVCDRMGSPWVYISLPAARRSFRAGCLPPLGRSAKTPASSTSASSWWGRS